MRFPVKCAKLVRTKNRAINIMEMVISDHVTQSAQISQK